jgi:LCP family protein required for cell wall assembly
MRNKKIVFLALSITVIVVLVLSYFFFNSLLAKPLGPSLKDDLAGQPTSNLDQLHTLDQTSFPVSAGQPLQTLQAFQTQVPLPTQGTPLCGNTPVLTILVSGIDFRGDNYLYGLADVIRIVRVDFTVPKVTIFTLDRDLWVEIPGIQAHYDITHGKLNQAYFYGVPAMGYYDGTAGGSGLLAKTLKLNFGLTVDNYLVVSMAAFTKGVDALGGIDVNVPTALDGSPEGMSSFDPGPQHLDGARALDLARIREGYSSLIRITNQDAIIKGITDKITSPQIILKIPALLQALNGTVLTDLSPNQINDLVCLVKKMNGSDLNFAEIPDSYYSQGNIYDPNMNLNTFIWNIDFNVIRQYVSAFQSGRWP